MHQAENSSTLSNLKYEAHTGKREKAQYKHKQRENRQTDRMRQEQGTKDSEREQMMCYGAKKDRPGTIANLAFVCESNRAHESVCVEEPSGHYLPIHCTITLRPDQILKPNVCQFAIC